MPLLAAASGKELITTERLSGFENLARPLRAESRIKKTTGRVKGRLEPSLQDLSFNIGFPEWFPIDVENSAPCGDHNWAGFGSIVNFCEKSICPSKVHKCDSFPSTTLRLW